MRCQNCDGLGHTYYYPDCGCCCESIRCPVCEGKSNDERFRDKWGTDTASVFLRMIAERLSMVPGTEQSVIGLLDLANDLQDS